MSNDLCFQIAENCVSPVFIQLFIGYNGWRFFKAFFIFLGVQSRQVALEVLFLIWRYSVASRPLNLSKSAFKVDIIRSRPILFLFEKPF